MSWGLDRRRELRAQLTDAERLLWNELRGRRLAGFKFRRQHPCGPYILDFYCAELRLAIELDGGQHYQPPAQRYDVRRTTELRRRGVVVLRFQNDVVLSDPAAVREEIARALGLEVP